MTRSWRGRRLLVVVAHPDDETFGCGSLIADAALGGAEVTVCCATRGEAGELAAGCDVPSGSLGGWREQELRDAARVLGVSDVVLLDFVDSGVDGEPAPESLV
ncbi:MAG TPA: PIG-L family deacetylase, partial [Acidimicrobiales bacterium]|nr:PIG-L family deacetylase [Acidimicrobiales bacterium]